MVPVINRTAASQGDSYINLAESLAPSQRHIRALDGLRGLAVLLVMFHHILLDQGQTPLDQVIRSVRGIGWIGVEFFFALSGFLITRILFDSRGGGNYFRNFYARRMLRIFPLYYAVVIGCLVLIPLVPQLAQRVPPVAGGWSVSYWLYLSNIHNALHPADGHPVLYVAWSLAVEEQFYIVWPFVVAMLSRGALMRVCVGVAVVGLGFRSLCVSGIIPIENMTPLTPARLDSIAMGSLVALAFYQVNMQAALRRWAWPVLLSVGAAAIALAIYEGDFQSHPIGQTLGMTMVSIMAGALLIVVATATTGGAVHRLFNGRLLVMLGTYSYGLYLFHSPVRFVVHQTFSHWLPMPLLWGSEILAQLRDLAIAIPLTLAVAMVSWYCFESRFLKLKRHFAKKPPTTTLADPLPATAVLSPVPSTKREELV